VMVFDDRVELISPGSLPNHLTVEMIKSGVSVARNPLIFTFATKEIPYRGLGSGIKRVMEIAPKVEFVSDGETNYFTARIFRQKAATFGAGPVKRGAGPVKGPVKFGAGPVKRGAGPVKGRVNPVDAPVNCIVKGKYDSAVYLLEIIRANPGINKSALSRLSGINIRTVKRRIEETLCD